MEDKHKQVNRWDVESGWLLTVTVVAMLAATAAPQFIDGGLGMAFAIGCVIIQLICIAHLGSLAATRNR